MKEATYRGRQFFSALLARRAIESDRSRGGRLRALEDRLEPAQRRLFLTMDWADQRHCLDVYHLLVEWGYDHDDLLQAALLHDVGKSLARVRLWHRVAIVLAQAIHSNIIGRLGSDRPSSWRYPLYVHWRHADLGARLAQAVGCRPRVVELIRRHDEAGGDELLEALRRADRAR